MQNFGLRDVSVPPTVPEYATIAGAFAWNLVVKEAKVKDGETMMVGTESIRTRVQIVEIPETPESSGFYNRFGMWQLLPATSVH